MIKVYCDVCGNELERREASERLKRTNGRVVIEIMAAVGGVWNGGHVCHKCLLEIANTGQLVASHTSPEQAIKSAQQGAARDRTSESSDTNNQGGA